MPETIVEHCNFSTISFMGDIPSSQIASPMQVPTQDIREDMKI